MTLPKKTHQISAFLMCGNFFLRACRFAGRSDARMAPILWSSSSSWSSDPLIGGNEQNVLLPREFLTCRGTVLAQSQFPNSYMWMIPVLQLVEPPFYMPSGRLQNEVPISFASPHLPHPGPDCSPSTAQLIQFMIIIERKRVRYLDWGCRQSILRTHVILVRIPALEAEVAVQQSSQVH